MKDVCAIARVKPSSWSRAKSRGAISVTLLSKIEDALAFLEREAGGTQVGQA